MYKTDDLLICPVRAWASVVQTIQKTCPSSSPDTPVNTVYLPSASPTYDNPGKYAEMDGPAMIKLIRLAAADLGSAFLGFDPAELGTHSLRSGSAMAMHLDGVPVYTIMLIGRWSSDAFLNYLRPQVLQFTAGISKQMMLHQHFFSVPTLNPVAIITNPNQTTRACAMVQIRLHGCNPIAQARLVPRTPFNLNT